MDDPESMLTYEAQRAGPFQPAGSYPQLVICLLLAVIIGFLQWLCGDFVSDFTRDVLTHRYARDVYYILPKLTGHVSDVSEIYQPYLRSVFTAIPFLSEKAVRHGLSLEYAAHGVAILNAVLWGVGFAWLVYAFTRRLTWAMLGVIIAYNISTWLCFPIYGAAWNMGVSGSMTYPVFLMAVSALLLGRKWLCLIIWLFQLWLHPTTAVCWSPILIVLALQARYWSAPGFVTWNNRFYWILLVAPPLAGMIAGVLEAAGLLPFQANADYWALLRFQMTHSVFLFTDRYALPFNVFSGVIAAFLFGKSILAPESPVRRLNLLAAALGGGLSLLYLLATETQWSALSAMFMPLRFEAVLYFLMAANTLYIILGPRENSLWQKLWAAFYFTLLMMPTRLPALAWAWAWCLGHHWLENRRNGRLYLVGGLAGVLAMIAYTLFAPSDHGLAAKLPIGYRHLTTAAWFALGFATTGLIGRLKLLRYAVPVLLVAIALWANFEPPRTPLFKNPGTGLRTFKYILAGTQEDTDERRAIQWINNNIEPGAPVLSNIEILLHLLTVVNTSINGDLMSFYIYAPKLATPIADEFRILYDLDIQKFKKERKRLLPTDEQWLKLRGKALDGEMDGYRRYDYVVEPSRLVASDKGRIIFDNQFLRIYEINRP